MIPDFHGQISMGSYIVILETKEPNEPRVISFNTKLTLLLGIFLIVLIVNFLYFSFTTNPFLQNLHMGCEIYLQLQKLSLYLKRWFGI